MTALSPAPADLGFDSPALGPWFGDPAVRLALPEADLACPVDLSGLDPSDGAAGADDAATTWRPPARGVLRLHVATGQRPRGLAGLRAADGGSAFADGALVARFTLLPEVTARLDALLLGRWPIDDDDDGADTARRRRPIVTDLALEVRNAHPDDVAALFGWLDDGGTDSEQLLEQLGLAATDDGALTNGAQPMSLLSWPVEIAGEATVLAELSQDIDARLWAFDDRGRPLDAGAVAAWWQQLGDDHDDLWALEDAARTAATAPGRCVQLVNLHQGPAPTPVLDRLEAGGVGDWAPVVLVAEDAEDDEGSDADPDEGPGPVTLSFAEGSDDGDDPAAPLARMGLLPDGELTETLTLWPEGPELQRDFARVVLVDLERHLLGQPRLAPDDDPGAGDAGGPPPGIDDDVAARRAADQARASTRVEVARAEGEVFRTTIDSAASDLVAACDDDAPARLVTPVLDRGFGPLDPPDLPDEPLGASMAAPKLLASALLGGGAPANDGAVTDQHVLFAVTAAEGDDALPEGAWVRVHPHSFDHRRGRRVRWTGGGGRVDGDGTAQLVAALPDGASGTRMAADVVLVTGADHRRFADVRFERPDPLGGEGAESTDEGEYRVCETGVDHSGGLPTASVPSGASVVRTDGEDPALVHRDALDDDHLDGAIAHALGSDDVVLLCPPAFAVTPRGDVTTQTGGDGAGEGAGAAGAASVGSRARVGLDADPSDVLAPGTPRASQDRLEVLVATEDAGAAALGSTPLLARFHELLPHQTGHAGAPATEETHGTGARLHGPVARLARETAAQLSERATGPLLLAALDEPDTAEAADEPDAAGCWAAVLRTVAFGSDGEPGLATLAADEDGIPGPYPFEDSWTDLLDWVKDGLEDAGPLGVDPEDVISGLEAELENAGDGARARVTRAADRRVLAARYGLREAATALEAAFARAEDLVYLETPALDPLPVGPSGGGGVDDQLDLVGRLVDRLTARPGLRVVLCVPQRAPAGTPVPLARVRDAGIRAAVSALRSAAPGRVALFHPSAGQVRPLHLAATTVVVDDAWALTGTTHLTRRGLSFDGSLAAVGLDERLADGRCAAIRSLRRQLLADRLDLDLEQVPDAGGDLVDAVAELSRRGGGRVLALPIEPHELDDDELDADIWNPDGSAGTELGPFTWFAALLGESSALDDHLVEPDQP